MILGLHDVKIVDLSQRVRWYAFVRILFIFAIAVPTFLSIYLFQGMNDDARNVLVIAGVALFSNFVFYGLLRLHPNSLYQMYLALIWLVFDIILVTGIVYTNGGIESRTPILYMIPILISAALFGRQGIYMSSLASTVLYVGLIVSDYFNFIESTGAIDTSLRSNLPYVVKTISFFPAVFLVVALAVDFIIGLLSEKQEQLRQSIDALERAQETAKLGSWEWDRKTNEISWSQELYRIYELDPEVRNLTYDDYLAFIHPDDVAEHRRVIKTALTRNQPFKTDHRVVLSDGTIKYLHGEGRPTTDRNGRVIKLTGTAQDVTEMYHLDLAKREFVSLASHQLRTPASGVKAFLSLLIDGHAGPLNRKQREFAKKAYESNSRQLRIIESLLSLASIESGRITMNTEPIELGSFVNRCLGSHRHAARAKQHALKYEKPTKKVEVVADMNALQMAIDNLISNAIKYTLDGGTITVKVSRMGRQARIEVVDTGIGIAKKDLPILFQKFSRLSDPASRTVEGSGLGLYMARYIVELHKGKLSVRSTHGVGTRFIIKLPLAPQKKLK